MAKFVVYPSVKKAIIECAHNYETLKNVQKHRPAAAELYEADGKTVAFKVAPTTGNGTIGTYGASFTEGEKGAAVIILDLPEDVTSEKAAEWVHDTVGAAYLKVNKIETQIGAALTEIAADLAALSAAVTIA